MSNKSEENNLVKIWEYVPLGEYKKPPKPISEKVRSTLGNFMQKLFLKSDKPREYKPYNKLTAFSKVKLDRIVPEPDWHTAIEEIDCIVENFRKNKSKDKYVLAIIDKPYSGVESILKAWADTREDVSIVDPPSYDDIINDQKSVIENLEKNLDGLCLIPDLQRYFLRHEKGLNIVRSLNDLFSRHNDEPIILGCHSYAWKFLTEILYLNLKNVEVLIQQSLDHIKLENWILGLTQTVKKRILLYRDGASGHYIFKKQAEEIKNTDKSASSNGKFLQSLASYSKGLPIVAKEIWKSCLRIVPEEDFTLDEEETNDPKITYTIWVIPWSRVKLPSISNSYTRNELYVLHALLLHSGLTFEWLDILLTDIELYGMLQKLKKIGIVLKNEYDEYVVSPLAYPDVRKILGAEGFLLDELE